MKETTCTACRVLIALLLGSGWVGVAQAQSASGGAQQPARSDTPDLSPQTIDAGRAVFHGAGTCHACHGDDLEGGPMAPALRGPKWKHIDGSYGSILQRIQQGQDGTLMVAHPGAIDDQQAVQVASYVWAVSQGKTKP